MRGKLSDKPFPSVVRALSQENATGRLRLTQSGKIREILIESGIPVFASSTIAEEQIEHKLVQEGLISPEQLDAATLSSHQTSQPVEKTLVQTRAITRLGLQRILCELSTSIINSSSEWVTGDYRFVAAPKVPLEAKLIWTSTECVLSGARHASTNNSVLDAIAPDDRTVKPASHQGNTSTQSASLSSTEGYVLSCLQSPTTIGDASMLTGLSHMETRRAILVLMLLGLLEAEGSAAKGDEAYDRLAPAMVEAQQQGPPVVPEVQAVQYPVSSEQAVPDLSLKTQPASTGDSSSLSAAARADIGEGSIKPAAAWESEAWPLEFESNDYTTDDSNQIEFAPGDISFVEYPKQSSAAEGPDDYSSRQAKADAANNGVSKDRQRLPAEEMAASGPFAPTSASAREHVGSIFIPGAATPPAHDRPNSTPFGDGPAAPVRESPGSVFVPGAATPPGQETGSSAPLAAEPAASFRANTGSVYLPIDNAPPTQPPSDPAPFAAPPTAPLGEVRGSQAGTAEFNAPPLQYRAPASAPPQTAINADSGYGWNGESDPRLHQEWLDQTAAAARPDNDDDERFLKRVIDELDAKVRIAASADYYQILGVDKLASNGSITKAYERITRINDSHKSRWPYNAELQAQISGLMVVVNKAYETLGSPEKRRIYDMPSKQQAPAIEIERGSGASTGSIGARANAPWPAAGSAPTPSASGGLGSGTDHRNPYEAAAELYKRGRACFTASDLQAAAHLLRQAVNLDPNRSTYHYQLGMTLFILSQARAEHKHDKGCHVTCKMGGNLTRNQRIRHEAEQHLLKASELEPSNSDIKLKLALLYKDANMDRKAHQYFYEALMLDPNCHIARVELGMDDTHGKDEDQWIKDLMKDRMKKK